MRVKDCWGNPQNVQPPPRSILLREEDTCTFTNTEGYMKSSCKENEGYSLQITNSGVEFVDVTTMSDKQPVYAPVLRPVIDMSDSSFILDAIMRAGGIVKYRDKVHERHKEAYSTVEELDYKAACEDLGLSATETALKLALEEQTKYDSGKDRCNAGKKNYNIFYYFYRIFTFHRSPRET